MRVLPGVVALAVCASPQEPPPVTFHRTEIPVGGTPYAMLAADVTGDGRTDLVVADQSGDRLVILAGDGDGSFRRVAVVPAGPAPGGLAAADFDQDGDLDLAVANHETDHLTLLLGRGDGRFDPAPSSPLPLGVEPHVHLVVSADLNEDGHVDLVVDHRGAGGLRPLLGRGDGRFEVGDVIDMGGDPYRGVVVVDLDGDGHLDLATPNVKEAGVRLGRGDGTFGETRRVDVAPIAPFALAVGDVNGDGAPDLGVGSGEGSSEVVVLLGDGAGGLHPAPGPSYRAGSGATSMDAADLDGDGRDDLLVTAWESRDLTILFGAKDGMRSRTVEAGENPWAVTAADFDGDGRPDVATANYGGGSVTVLLTRIPPPPGPAAPRSPLPATPGGASPDRAG